VNCTAIPVTGEPSDADTFTTSGSDNAVPTSPTCPFPPTIVRLAGVPLLVLLVVSDPQAAPQRPAANTKTARVLLTNIEFFLPFSLEFATTYPLKDD
jgi:hypothetical protein